MIQLATIQDAPAINAILNDPSVYKWAAAGRTTEPLDISRAFNSLFTLISEDSNGCVIFDPYSIETAEVHTCLLPAMRGHEAEMVARDALRFAFAETGFQEVFTKIPVENKAADLFARQVGFVRISDGPEWRAYQFTIDRWPGRDPGLGAFCPMEITDRVQDVHQRQVIGAFMLMSLNGFMGKGVSFYNKHARLHEYPPMAVVGQDSVAAGGLSIHFSGGGIYRVEDVCQPLQQEQEL